MSEGSNRAQWEVLCLQGSWIELIQPQGGWIELMLIYKNTPLSNKRFNLLGHFVGLPVSSCPTLGPKIVPNISLELLWHKFQAYQSFLA